MIRGAVFCLASALLAATAATAGDWRLLLLWPAASFGIVALGYLRLGPRVYGKSPRGRLSPTAHVLLLPYLVCLWSAWHLARLAKREPAVNHVAGNVFIGRRLLPHEIPHGIDHVVDLTCEFNEHRALRSSSYHCFPILDGIAPAPGQLRQWTDHVAGFPGKVYIHCAEGHGRAGLFASALLLRLGHARTPEDALRLVKSRRPRVRLARSQMAALLAARDAPE